MLWDMNAISENSLATTKWGEVGFSDKTSPIQLKRDIERFKF